MPNSKREELQDTISSHDLWREIAIFFGILSALLLTYSPVFLTSYAFLDDYRILAESLQKDTSVLGLTISGGRPVQGLLLWSLFSALSDISDLCWMRAMGVIAIAGLAFMLYRLLARAKWPRYQSAILALIMCVMPAYQVYSAWAVLSSSILAGVLSVGAGWLVSYLPCRRSWAAKVVLGGLSGLALGVAFCIYQPVAMLYVVAVAIILLIPEAKLEDLWRPLAAYGSVEFLGLGIGFAVYKYGQTVSPLPGARSEFVYDVMGKADWFVGEPLVQALNLVSLSVSKLLAFGVGVFIVVGLLLYFRKSFLQRIGLVGLALALIPLSYLPNLATAENWASYRTQGALSSLVVLYVFFALHGYWRALRLPRDSRAMKCIMVVTALVCALVAASNVLTLFVWPQQMELHFVRSQLRQQDLAEVESIYFIRAHWSDSIAPLQAYDEFGLPSSCAKYVPKSMVYLLLREIAPSRMSIPVQSVAWDEVGVLPAGALEIDMRKLREYR